jgi:hypothetical protein
MLQRSEHAVRAGNDKIDDKRRAAGERRESAALPRLSRCGAHEGHLEMGVRVDAARHDICAVRVERLVALQILADRRDLLTLYKDVRLISSVGRNNCAALDDRRHALVLSLWLILWMR